MPFLLSPQVTVTEKDFSQYIKGVATSIGALVGDFSWGPMDEVTNVSNEQQLVNVFDTPTNNKHKEWFTAINFLSYANNLNIVRASNKTVVASCTTVSGNASVTLGSATTLSVGMPVSGTGIAPGSTILTVTDSTHVVLSANATASGTASLTFITSLNAVSLDTGAATAGQAKFVKNYTDFSNNAPTLTNIRFLAKYPGTVGNNISVAFATSVEFPTWAYKGYFPNAPRAYAAATGKEIYFIVKFRGQIVEQHIVNTDSSIKNGYGEYYGLETINRNSQYIYVNTVSFPNNATALTGNGVGTDALLSQGIDGTATQADLLSGWDLFADPNQLDINLLMQGGAGSNSTDSIAVGTYMIQNIAEVRKDCVAFVSPMQSEVVNNAAPVTAMLAGSAGGTGYPSSSYAFMDGSYKYQYDKYNDTYRWIPLNGDIAGLCARTDTTNDAWWSPAGYNRGKIKNVIKLSWQPSLANRDDMYKNNINPIITERGEGTLLLGDKTRQAMASAFDRINVRRLFIVLEKAIATQAKYNLFEFNDAFTRSHFVQTITPFLRSVQGRRGIVDFKVVADETVNTPQVIDSNEFRAVILIKPNKSINFIGLTFTAVSSGVSFDEFVNA